MWSYVISNNSFVSRYSSPDETLSTGKWVVNFPLNDPDDLWDRLVTAASFGRIAAVKRSSERLDKIAGHHIACVYCRSSDEETVKRTLALLREIGVSGPLRYKSDKATVEGRDEYLYESDILEGGPGPGP